MTHADLKKHLADYLEGDLSLERRAQVDAHLDECADCAQDVAEMQETIQLLRLMPDPEPPPMVSANVMRRIRAGETEPGFLTRLTRGFGSVLEPSFVLPASAIAAAALVVALVQDPGALTRITGFGASVTQDPVEPATGWASVPTDTAGLGNVIVAGADRSASPQNPGSREPAAGGVPGLASGSRIQISIAAQPLQQHALASAPLFASAPVLHGGASTGQGSAMDRRTRAVAESWGIGAGGDPRLHRVSQPRTASASQPRAASASQPRAASGLQPQGASALASTTYSAGSPAGSDGARGFQQPNGLQGSGGFQSSGGEDARDVWLVRGLADPVGFARFLASKNLAEQELWVSRLAERALARGLLDDLVMALRASGDAPAAVLSDDFAAQAAPSADVAPVWNAPYER